MVITAVVMAVGEWKTRYRWVPITMLLVVVGATCLTIFVVFPVNAVLREGISDQNQLLEVIERWIFLTKIRVGIWSLEWILMMFYFASRVYAKD